MTHVTVPDFVGEVIAPGDVEYDTARRVFNGLIDKRPTVILRCRTRTDIVAAVRHAVDAGVEIAVRAGGHSVAGHSSTDGGIVIDLSAMRKVTVDPQRRVAYADAGATWGDVDAATVRYGLACPGGVVSSTGVGGFSLGGGIGWLSRQHGLTCDNLIGAELVTADGSVLTVSEAENPDVLWGLRGGGGNFGVVARFTLSLHPVDQVVAGARSYPESQAVAVLAHFRDQMSHAPDHVSAILDFASDLTSGRRLVSILGFSPRPDNTGRHDISELLAVRGATAAAAVSVQHTLTYPTWQRALDHTAPFGSLNYWNSIFVTDLSDEAIRRIALVGASRPSLQTRLHLIRLGGAASRVDPASAAIATRSQSYVVHLMTTWTEHSDSGRCMSWARRAYGILRPLGPAGAYLNFVGDEGQDRIRASFGDERYRRLTALKARLDPDNRFRLNHNIIPAG